MYELIKITDQTYYVNCPAKIGIYIKDGKNAYLIDSGNDKDAGKKVLRILEQNGWELKGILNTHSNADHIGGNKFLQGKTNCRIYAEGIEGAMTKAPILEPAFLYGGYPCKDIRNKFLMAQPSEVTAFSDETFPKDVEIIPLPGHFFEMVGFRMSDGTVFLADCISSKETIDKYAITFIYDVEAYLKTLDMVENMEASIFIPSHAEPSEDIRELVQYNRKKVFEIAECIQEICKEPQIFEVILQKLFQHYDCQMNFNQYVLLGSTVRSYLSWLKENGRLKVEFENCLMLWKTVE